ncbi:MAG: response regulator [candidate division WOR-3 bacterium]
MKKRILWIDDQIDNLKSLSKFLENEGYEVIPSSSGQDGLERVKNETFDLIILDQYMPGLDGIETLSLLKEYSSNIPVIMVTKADDKDIIKNAISLKINDYLIKPINAMQLLTTIKRILENKKIISDSIGERYSNFLKKVEIYLNGELSLESFYELHRISSSMNIVLNEFLKKEILSLHEQTKENMNKVFAKFISKNYPNFLKDKSLTFSHRLFEHKVFPVLKQNKKILFLLIDCMRYDQYLILESTLSEYFRIVNDHYFSIIPTATPFSRNSIFSGFLPVEIYKIFPERWEFEDTLSQNQYEEEFLKSLAKKNGFDNVHYSKVSTNENLSKYISNFSNLKNNTLNILVINIMDIFTHIRSESNILKDMLPDESSLLFLMGIWIKTSGILELLEKSVDNGFTIFITSDHGSIVAKDPIVLNTGKDVSINLKYKFGSSISPQSKDLLVIDKPDEFGLPVQKPNDKWYITFGNGYFIYSTKLNQYKKEYYNTFQHGGISMEEMILPIGIIEGKYV